MSFNEPCIYGKSNLFLQKRIKAKPTKPQYIIINNALIYGWYDKKKKTF